MGHRLRQGLFYVILAAGVVCLYLLVAFRMGYSGFPLDDAWIHQTYARNLATTGRWEYISGQASAGSTAPFWTWLLSWGYRLHLPYRIWTLGWGIVLLGLVGVLSHRLAVKMIPEPAWIGWIAGILCAAEWHLVWAAVSGMETVLFLVLSLGVLNWMAINRENMGRDNVLAVGNLGFQSVVFGLLAGLLVLTRPEGVMIIGVAGLFIVYNFVRGLWPSNRLGWLFVGAAIPFGLLLLPYIQFNMSQSGRLWPNTFYAKQAEYALWQQASFLQRFGRIVLPPLIGFQILILPGLLLIGWRAISRIWSLFRKRQIYQKPVVASKRNVSALSLLLLLYSLLYSTLFTWRLPVDYQHGRYLMPIIPPLVLAGLEGSFHWLDTRHPSAWRRITSKSWTISLGILLVAFLFMGADAYAQDVQVIQNEMVAVAEWLSENTAQGEWVAAHDIGAIGYFANRPILDLAGLITPEVVSVLGDERLLADMVLNSQANYLVTAPGWPYSSLTSRPDVQLLFQADSSLTRESGLNNSAIYSLPQH
ncbi:MAG: hypothetical protein JXA42_12875 [Anaerolineales bacterium]|nr:hypothetical protein [Anaerolineales bacterium]